MGALPSIADVPTGQQGCRGQRLQFTNMLTRKRALLRAHLNQCIAASFRKILGGENTARVRPSLRQTSAPGPRLVVFEVSPEVQHLNALHTLHDTAMPTNSREKTCVSTRLLGEATMRATAMYVCVDAVEKLRSEFDTSSYSNDNVGEFLGEVPAV